MSATAETLIRDLCARGVRLSRSGENLRIAAPRGTLTLELRQTLAEAKPAILAALTTGELRGRLLILAIEESIAPELVNRLPAVDVEACAELPPKAAAPYRRWRSAKPTPKRPYMTAWKPKPPCTRRAARTPHLPNVSVSRRKI